MNRWITKSGIEIHQVLKGRSNCFLVLKNDKALLVDTGRITKRKILVRRIDQYQLQSIVAIILTHAHFDHAENAAYLKGRYRAPIYIHRSEADFLKSGSNPPITGSFALIKFFTTLWEKQLKKHFNYIPAEYDVLIDEKYDLTPLGFEAYLLHTPGHSPGSMSLIIDNEIAIVGDAMFGVVKRLIYPPFAYDPEMMIRSWGKLLDTGCKIYLPAHGTQNSRELIKNQFEKYKY